MRQIVLGLIIVSLAGCAAARTGESVAPYRAIYLTRADGQLRADDLRAHPEILVTDSFDKLKPHASARIAFWIDINAADAVDKDWLNQAPQKYYPIALVGSSDALCSFREMLGGFGVIEGPYVDCASPPPGFSVWMLESQDGSNTSAFMRGYRQTPTVDAIVAITDPLVSRPPEVAR